MADVTHPPVASLERLAAELALPGDDAVRAHVDSCLACTARMRDVLASREAYLALHPPATRTSAIIGARRARGWVWGVAAAAVAACAVAAVVWWWPREVPPPVSDRVVLKGGGDPVVSATVRRGGTVERLDPRGTVRAGDVLHFEVGPGAYRWLGVFDASGPAPVRVLEVSPAVAAALPQDFAIDDAGVSERIVFVFAERPLDDAAAQACIAGGTGCRVIEYRLAKQDLPTRGAPGVGPGR